MWELYDRLIENIPDDIPVAECVSGEFWSYVRAGKYAGVAMTVKENPDDNESSINYTGMSLKQLAEYSKSWNFKEASLGVAAINAFYNTEDKIFRDSVTIDEGEGKEAFMLYKDKVKGKKVAVIGHFPTIQSELGSICDLSILERRPQKGDYPDPACEYILPDQDFLFITGVTLINKTLPRLLQIVSDHCEVVMVGPSVPLTKIMYDHGADALSGFYVKDKEKMKDFVGTGNNFSIFAAGQMVNITKK